MDFTFIEDEGLRKQAEDAYKSGVKSEAEKLAQGIVEKEYTGLKSKNETLLDEVKKSKAILKKLDGLDIDAAKEAMDFLDKNEKARLIKENKWEELLAKETSQIRTTFEEQVEGLSTENATLKNEKSLFKSKYETKLIEDGIRKAAIDAGVRPEALDDILSRGLRVWSLDGEEKLEARTKDEAKKLIKTEEGNVLTPKLWMESLKNIAPHYWPESEGIGALGDGASPDELMDAMEKAASSGNMPLYRKLRQKMLDRKNK